MIFLIFLKNRELHFEQYAFLSQNLSLQRNQLIVRWYKMTK